MPYLLLSMLLVFCIDGSELDSIRINYNRVDSKESLEQFFEHIKAGKNSLAVPYLASAYMQKAKYELLPTTKLKYFIKGKEMLEQFIVDHPKNIDARYVRYLVQNNIPRFLGYSDNIQQDKNFLNEHLKDANISLVVKEMMINNLQYPRSK